MPGLSWARRSRPGQPGSRDSPRLPACRSGLPRPCPLLGVAGWGALPNHVVARAAVPDWGARPFRTGPPRCGCQLTGCGPVLAQWPPRESGRDQRDRDLSCTPCSWRPDPADHGPARGPCPRGGFASIIREKGWGVEGRNHSQLRGTRTAAVSSRTGVPPSRGRPSEQPEGSVVHPTRPPPQGEGVEANRRNPTRGPEHGAGAGRPGPGTARPPAGNRPDRPDGPTRSHPDRQAPDRRRARSELPVAHGCLHDHEHP